MKRRAIVFNIFGVIFNCTGSLFLLLAKFISVNFFIPMIPILSAGAILTICSIIQSNPTQSPNSQKDDWLPIDDWRTTVWYNAFITSVPCFQVAALSLFLTSSLLSVVVTAITILIILLVLLVYAKEVYKSLCELFTIMGTDSEFRPIIHYAFITRRNILKIYNGIPKNRRFWWKRRISECDDIVSLVITSAKRATDIKGISKKAETRLVATMNATKDGFDQLAENFADAVTGSDQVRFDTDLANLRETIAQLSDLKLTQEELQNA